jgi:hypothetical protein
MLLMGRTTPARFGFIGGTGGALDFTGPPEATGSGVAVLDVAVGVAMEYRKSDLIRVGARLEGFESEGMGYRLSCEPGREDVPGGGADTTGDVSFDKGLSVEASPAAGAIGAAIPIAAPPADSAIAEVICFCMLGDGADADRIEVARWPACHDTLTLLRLDRNGA